MALFPRQVFGAHGRTTWPWLKSKTKRKSRGEALPSPPGRKVNSTHLQRGTARNNIDRVSDSSIRKDRNAIKRFRGETRRCTSCFLSFSNNEFANTWEGRRITHAAQQQRRRTKCSGQKSTNRADNTTAVLICAYQNAAGNNRYDERSLIVQHLKYNISHVTQQKHPLLYYKNESEMKVNERTRHRHHVYGACSLPLCSDRDD